MKKNFLPLVFFTLMALLLCVQGTFLLYPAKFQEREAARLHSRIVTAADKLRAAEKDIAGLAVYLTAETADGAPSAGEIAVNGKTVGNLCRGVLMFRCKEGDEITLHNAENREYILREENGFLDRALLPSRCRGKKGDVLWGRVHFK